MLDESALNALDIQEVNQNDLQRGGMSNLERMVDEQKRKRVLANTKVIRRLSVSNGLGSQEGEQEDNDLLNESLPDHFHVMKIEDALNESRPGL